MHLNTEPIALWCTVIYFHMKMAFDFWTNTMAQLVYVPAPPPPSPLSPQQQGKGADTVPLPALYFCDQRRGSWKNDIEEPIL